jgi:hypothetical protein
MEMSLFRFGNGNQDLAELDGYNLRPGRIAPDQCSGPADEGGPCMEAGYTLSRNESESSPILNSILSYVFVRPNFTIASPMRRPFHSGRGSDTAA